MAKKLGEFATINENFISVPIALPDVTAEWFYMKPHLVTMVQPNRFGGFASKDSGMHLHTFTKLCDMAHIKDSEPYTLKLLSILFLFERKS